LRSARWARALLVPWILLASASSAWSAWHSFGPSDGLTGAQFSALAGDQARHVWAGSEEGLFRYDGAAWLHVELDTSVLGSTIHVPLDDHAGSLWVGTQLGLVRLSGQSAPYRYTPANTGGGLPPGAILALWEDRARVLWMGTEAGVCRLDSSRTHWDTFTFES